MIHYNILHKFLHSSTLGYTNATYTCIYTPFIPHYQTIYTAGVYKTPGDPFNVKSSLLFQNLLMILKIFLRC